MACDSFWFLLFLNATLPKNVPAMRARAGWGDLQTNLGMTFKEIVEAGGTWFTTERADDDQVLTMCNLNRDIVIQ